MPLLSKAGSILRQTANKQLRSELSPFRLSIHQAIRCTSSMASSEALRGFFSEYWNSFICDLLSSCWAISCWDDSSFVMQVVCIRQMNKLWGKLLRNLVKLLTVYYYLNSVRILEKIRLEGIVALPGQLVL